MSGDSAALTGRGSAALDMRPGALAAVLVIALYGGLAVSVDFPRAAYGFQSDEATYYMMAHSLARDGDLTYRRGDLVDVWSEFPAGPSGLFLKRGRDLELHLDGNLPFVHITSNPDGDASRLYYGKSFAYPMAAAPWVLAFGTNGFLLFHTVLLGLVVLAGSAFLAARMHPGVAALLAAGLVLGSVAPSYVVWTTPEIFNFALVFLAYFCWLFKEVAGGRAMVRGARWLTSPASDVVAVALLAVVSFSKPPNALLAVPMGLLWLARRRPRRAVLCGAVFTAIVLGLFAVNIGITGDWNFQGGDRRTYVGAFPFLPGGADFNVGLERATDRVLTEIIFGPDSWTVLRHNLGYFFVGRYSGIVPYFFPAVFAAMAFLLARRRAGWQWLVCGAIVAEVVLMLVWNPYNYFGGGGVLGNRYFMSVYGLFLFLLPPIGSAAVAAIPWVVGTLFTATITLNPFHAAFHPADHAARGLVRWLPVELSLTNDLPINTSESRVKRPYGGDVPFLMYFLDGNVYLPSDASAFWVRGESVSDSLVRGPAHARRLVLTLTAGPRANVVTVRIAGRTKRIEMTPDQTTTFSVPLDSGFPYLGTRVWTLSIKSRSGFVPMFTLGGVDNRFLGVQVTPSLMP